MTSYAKLQKGIKFYKQPEVSWTCWLQLACVKNKKITAFGRFLQKKLQDGTFIDIPCGMDCTILPLLEKLGVAHYIEADVHADILKRRQADELYKESTLHIKTCQADVLDYIANFDNTKNTSPIVWYISGLQHRGPYIQDPKYQNNIAVPYTEALYKELDAKARKQDFVILNDANALVLDIDEKLYPNIHPSVGLAKHGFTLIKSCAHQKVQVFQKT